jgi:hypothetical protein
VWEKFKYQLSDCFTGSCRRTRARIIVQQKNPLEQQTSPLSLSINVRGFYLTTKKTDYGSLIYNGAIRKRRRHLSNKHNPN